MAVATDNFNRADANPATGWTWVGGTGNGWWQTYTNIIYNGGNYLSCGAWPTATNDFGDDHYSTLVVVAADASAEIGPAVRCQGAGSGNFYAFLSTSGSSRLVRVDGGTITNLATGGAGVGAADEATLEVVGGNLVAKINGVQELTASDSTYSTGQPGIAFNGAVAPNGDDWEGGDLAAGSYTLTADAGAVAVAGGTTTFVLTVPGDAGAFALTGYDGALLAARLVTAAAGALALAGTDAGLEQGYAVAAASGAVTIMGGDVWLRVPVLGSPALGRPRFTSVAGLRAHGGAGRGIRR